MQSYNWGGGLFPAGATYMDLLRNREGKIIGLIRRPLTLQHLLPIEVEILQTLAQPGIGLLLQKEIQTLIGTSRPNVQRKLRGLKEKGLVHQPRGRSGGFGITSIGVELLMEVPPGLMPT